MNSMQTNGDDVGTPEGDRSASAVAGGDLAPIKGDGDIELGTGLSGDNRCGQMESNLEGMLYGSALVKRLSAMKLLR